MSHSMLITGRNQVVKEELFSHFWADFECLTCSARCGDIKNHLKHFEPDVLLCCLQDEERFGAQQILELQELLADKKLVVAVVGTRKDCAFFAACAPNLAKFVFEQPLNPGVILDSLLQFLDKKEMNDLLGEISAYGAQKRVMVIDDDPFMRKLMTGYLQGEYDVETASSGKNAMRQLSAKSVDLILLDYEMPEESGPQVLERLHQNPATKDIPVIILTSITYREMIEKVLLLKPQGYLVKPVNREKLLEAIKNLLG